MVTLQGMSGRFYAFSLYQLGEPPPYAGVYAVAREDQSGLHLAYIGEAGDVRSRLGYHEKRVCFGQHLTNVIAVHFEANAATRCDVERDLIAFYDPPCNKETIDLGTLLTGSAHRRF